MKRRNGSRRRELQERSAGLWDRIREAAERVGYGPRDVSRLIAEVRIPHKHLRKAAEKWGPVYRSRSEESRRVLANSMAMLSQRIRSRTGP